MKKMALIPLAELEDRQPVHRVVANVDLMVTLFDGSVSVLYGRCLHRGALLADGSVEGDNVICGLHGWDYRLDSGVSEFNNDERLEKFQSWVEDDTVYIDADEIAGWEKQNPQPYKRDGYQGTYADVGALTYGTAEEPHVKLIHELAQNGLKKTGHHGPAAAMGVPRTDLPSWDDIQVLTAQLHQLPKLDDESVDTSFVIGPRADQPLRMDLPIFVSDMSFGALSEEAKIALSKGADQAGVGICSGEGGMLPEEQENNRRYLYELASGRFGFSWDKVERCQAFHFKCGQGAKTGTGGHLPGNKVNGRIAEVREIEPGTPAISPSRFPDWDDLHFYKDFAAEVRERTGGIPIGYKMSAQHIEHDLDAALEGGADYIILDGRGGGTGAAPLIFRDHISVPSIPALARARRHLDACGAHDVTLIVTGGLRTPADFVKALALGADGIAIANSAIQAIGCLGMRACNSNNCPVGIATQKEHLRRRLVIDEAAGRLRNFLTASAELMTVLARACGHSSLSDFNRHDITSWKKEIAELAGISWAGEPLPTGVNQ